ncbi:MAG: response regulator transcription factor [Gordonia sp. (in: high G+C Gram-positive bacteria)]
MTAAERDRPTRRIGIVEDHPVIVDGLRSNIAQFSHLEVTASAPTVQSLLAMIDGPEGGAPFDLVILDLHGLPDGSRPAENIAALSEAGVENILVYTYGERRTLVQEAARSGVLAVIRKTENGAHVADAICRAAEGEAVASLDWAAAIDADSDFRPKLSLREAQVLELYASGEEAHRIATSLKIKEGTVRVYVKRIKAKYATVGRHVYTKHDLREAARRDGYL